MGSRDLMFGIARLVLAYPSSFILLLFATTLIFTRVRTGYLKSKHENETRALEKEVPILAYWLPYLGHAPSFGWSFDDLLTYGRVNTKDGIFGLHLMGVQHYMVVMPSLARQLFLKRQAVLSSDDFLFWVHDKYFGDGGAARETPVDDFRAVHRSLNSLVNEPFLSNATAKTAELLEDRAPQMVSIASSSGELHPWERAADATVNADSVQVDLFKFIFHYVADISGIALMGQVFHGNNPSFIQDLWTFDAAFNALLTGVPAVTQAIRNAKAARARLRNAMNEFNHAVTDSLEGKDPTYRWNDLSDVSETMRLRVEALNAIKAEDRLAISQNLAVYWGLMVNANKVIFWMLLEIASSTDLLPRIRSEIEPFAKINRGGVVRTLKLDVNGLVKACPLLKATFFEVMRLYTAGTTYKKVLEDVTLTESAEDAAAFGKLTPQKYHIAAGNYLVIPHAQIQTDPRTWQDPTTFKPERFLIPDEASPGKVRADMLNLMAFGGGYSICKGRYYAEREILAVIASFLAVWEFDLGGNSFKMPAKFYNGTGSANPKAKVMVKIRHREM